MAWPVSGDGRYTVTSSLGAGGMGRVFAARDEHLGRDVAIKVSHDPVAGADLDERLRHEAQVLARLEHPGIVPVHDLGRLADGRLYYVMKLVRGRTLSAERAQLTTDSARLSVVERVVEAVAFAHAQGVVHRDLKPANVMVGQFGEVLVMDWGVARWLAQGAEGLSRVGTPGFMAPEQAGSSADRVGPPADVYALGALLQWLWDGQPRPARRLRAIIARCLAADPAGRYPDAAALAADLARYRAGLAVEALPETFFDRALRFASRHLTLIILIAAYLLMRTLVAWYQSQ